MFVFCLHFSLLTFFCFHAGLRSQVSIVSTAVAQARQKATGPWSWSEITEGNVWLLVSSRQSRFLQSFFKNLPQSWFLHGRTAAPAVALSKENCRWASHALRILQSLSSSVAELSRKFACTFRCCCEYVHCCACFCFCIGSIRRMHRSYCLGSNNALQGNRTQAALRQVARREL